MGTKLHKFMSTYTYTAQLEERKKKGFYLLLFNGNEIFIYR